MLNTTWFQSIAISSVGMPSIAIRPPWAMFASMTRSAAGLAGHLEADVEALVHPQLALDVGEVRWRTSTRDASRPTCAASASRCGLTSVTTIVAGAGVADDRRRHQPDRAGARDQHVLAEHG